MGMVAAVFIATFYNTADFAAKQSRIDIGNDRIQPVRAGDSTRVKTADRALGCNSLFVDYIGCRAFSATCVRCCAETFNANQPHNGSTAALSAFESIAHNSGKVGHRTEIYEWNMKESNPFHFRSLQHQPFHQPPASNRNNQPEQPIQHRLLANDDDTIL